MQIGTTPQTIRQLLRVLSLIKRSWISLTTVVLAGILVQVLGMAIPHLSQLLIDRAYPTHNISLLNVLVGLLIAVNISSVAIRSARSYFSIRLSARLNNSICLLFFNHIQHLPTRFFDWRRTGEIVSRFQDINTSINVVTNTFQTVLMNSVYVLLVPPFLVAISWKLALLSLSGVPLNIYVTYRAGHDTRRYLRKTAERFAELRGVQTEVIDNVRTHKTMMLERYSYAKVDRLASESMRLQLKASRIGSYYGAVNGLVRAVSSALYTWIGWHMIVKGQISLGQFIAFTAYIGFLYTPISEIVSLVSDVQQASVSIDRMFEYLDESTEQDPALAVSPVGPIQYRFRGNIELKSVVFGYEPGLPVLLGIDLRIRCGTLNAIVGPSGSGKTSLLRLITALDRAESGRICLDGRDVADISISDIRRQISVVWQETGIIRGSVKENLILGSESATDEFVKEIVRLCRLEDLVGSLPNGYETQIAEKGCTLSAGQRQRIAIARALIRQTPVLILDEATSNIDIETENCILSGIFSRFPGKTIIFVGHRLSLLPLADCLFIMHGGRIAEVGTHDELLAQNGLYARMHDAKSGPGFLEMAR
jgi:ABC-type bacteriocin/lantibiotic exporter with double-glycine peptidase domain